MKISRNVLVGCMVFLTAGVLSNGRVLGSEKDARREAVDSTTTVRAVSLRCEYLENPLGIDVTEPRLSWRIENIKANVRGQKQTAYQILVAASAAVCW